MEKRRLTGLIALIVLLVAIGGIITYDYTRPPNEPTTAAAPAAGATDALADADSDVPEDEDTGEDVAALAPEAAEIADSVPESVMSGDEAPAAALEAPTDANGEQQTAAVAPSADVAPDATAQSDAASVPAPASGPSFDIVRVEATGDTVIAGQSEPNAKVELLDGATVIATTDANDRGEWTIVLDAPLTPGTHDLSIRTTSEDQSVVALSDQRVTVSVPEAGADDLLVVLNSPNEPSKVIEMSPAPDVAAAATGDADSAATAAPAEPGEADVAANAAPAPAGDEPAAGEPETAVAAAAPTTDDAMDGATDDAMAGETDDAMAGATDDAMAGDTETAAAASTTPPATTADDAAGAATETETAAKPEPPAEPTPAAPTESEVAAAESPAADAGALPAAEPEVAMAPASEEAATAAATPSADAATMDAPVQDDGKPAETVASPDKNPDASEVAAEPDAAPADTTGPATTETDVAAKPGEPDAEAVAPPATETEVAAKPDAPEAEAGATAPSEPEMAVQEPEAPPAPKPQVVVAAVEAETTGRLYVAGTAATGEPIRVYLDDELIGEVTPSPSGTWLIETTKDMPAGTYTVRVDQVGSGDTVIARSEVPFEREVEVAILKPSVTAEAAAGATLTASMPPMETVIIKRGDNLWRIARGTWGKGIRWSTIYRANDDQIRNPDLIYPGQVFMMPKGDTAWSDEAATPVQN